MPREGVISSYVVENSDGEITDFGSFYSLPSTVVNNKNHSTLNAAYCFYNVSDRLKDLMQDMLVIAHNQKFDVFNALDLMENEQFLKVSLSWPLTDLTIFSHLNLVKGTETWTTTSITGDVPSSRRKNLALSYFRSN